jgi:hypothetical protein
MTPGFLNLAYVGVTVLDHQQHLRPPLMTLAVPALAGGAPARPVYPLGAARARFAGKAGRSPAAANAKLSLKGQSPGGSRSLDLAASALTLTSLLEEDDGTELVRGTDGARLLPLKLVARRGSKTTEAIFETLSGARPRVRVEVKQRDPRTAELELSLAVEFATIPRLPSGCGPGSSVPLRARFSLAPASQDPVELAPLLSWRCGKNDLKTP